MFGLSKLPSKSSILKKKNTIMETKDIKKLWTIKNGEAAETWVNLNDLVNFIDEWSRELRQEADQLEQGGLYEEAIRFIDQSDKLDDMYFLLLKELK